MNQDDFSTTSEMADSLRSGACPAAGSTPCSLREAAAKRTAGRKGPKDTLTRCEAEAFLLLAPGHRVVVLDQETGHFWHGTVDAPFPEQGFVWVFTELGERKMLDITRHTLWRPAALPACGREG